VRVYPFCDHWLRQKGPPYACRARERGHRNNLRHLSSKDTSPKLVSVTLFRGAIDDRAIHVNATSTRMRLFGAVWDVENRLMTDGAGMKNARNQRLGP
jgi:hypothetical protein